MPTCDIVVPASANAKTIGFASALLTRSSIAAPTTAVAPNTSAAAITTRPNRWRYDPPTSWMISLAGMRAAEGSVTRLVLAAHQQEDEGVVAARGRERHRVPDLVV